MARDWRTNVVHNELSYWGHWHGLQMVCDLSSGGDLVNQLSMPKGPPSKTRVLILDPPRKWWPIHKTVLSLVPDYRYALIARYCVPPKDDGTMYSHQELSDALGWKPEEYRKNLRGAKRAYKLKIFG